MKINYLLFYYLYLVCLKEIKEAFMDGHGNPIPSTMLLSERSFFTAGRLMALSLIQGGPIPRLFSENMYRFISSPTVSPSIFTPPKEFLDTSLLKKVRFYLYYRCIRRSLKIIRAYV